MGVTPKAAGVDPAPNMKPLTEEDGSLADRVGVNDDDVPVPNKNVAPPEVDGAWKANVSNENGAAGVIALASSYGLDKGGDAPKLKLVLLAGVTLSFFFSASGAGVNPAPNAKGAAGVCYLLKILSLLPPPH